jgi:hypothetical protein
MPARPREAGNTGRRVEMRRVSGCCITFLLIALLGNTVPLWAEDPLYENIFSRFPRSEYVVGIGDVPKTGSSLRDRRVAEVLARRELAAQIRVQVSEVAIDIMCSGVAEGVFEGEAECRDEYSSVLETRVNEFIQGSRIADHGEYEGRVYAVAVMEKSETARELRTEAEDSAQRAMEHLRKAKEGDAGAREKARDEYLKAKALAAQSDAFEGVREQTGMMFEDLEAEIRKLGGE